MSGKRLGFLGVGWIGRHRMEKMLETGLVEAAVLSDPSGEMITEARKLAPHALIADSLDAMLKHDLDGVVIATPSALHASQSIEALKAGAAVFCQKPLGRNADETRAVVDAAREVDRLLGVDLSYRHTDAVQQIKALVDEGRLGDIFAADLVFHNAYGPGKPWFFDKSQSGGGCVIDLGVHLVDLALWVLGFPEVAQVRSGLFAKGRPIQGDSDLVEDYAVATLTLANGAAVRLACSWNLHAGQEAEIMARFCGTESGALLRNVEGSFYDFTAEWDHGTVREMLAEPPDDWGGRAAASWARRLADDAGFDAEIEKLVTVAEVLDGIYRGDG